mgnify:CR=1 FL=1
MTLSAGVMLANSVGGTLYQTSTGSNLVSMGPNALAPAGGDQPHNNMQPYLGITCTIALSGIFPPRD